MKIDPYNHKERFRAWQESVKDGIPGMSKHNSDIITKFLNDMEHGINIPVNSPKGGRSFIRLNTLRDKMNFFSRKAFELYGLDKLTDIDDEQLILLFSKMRNAEILKKDGNPYQSVNYYVRTFKAFWHWWQTVNKKKGVEIRDITTDLDARGTKPRWVYLTEEQVKQICDASRFDYKVLFMFLFDSGVRAPSELVNIKVSDLYNDCKEVMIRDEVSKTFGRRIKLMLSSELIKDYIKQRKLEQFDYLFPIKPATVNKYLQRVALKLFGDGKSPAGQKYSELSMYDFRHCSCCYWVPRYKSESALKYRFGWKKSDKIGYYSEMLGMRDTISEEDMLLDVTKTEIEQRLIRTERENDILKERMKNIEERLLNFKETITNLKSFN